MRRGVLAVFLVAISSSCSMLPTRAPGGGRCVDNADCGSGMTCDPGTLLCVCAGPNCPTDGGAGASGSGGAASGGHAGGAGSGSGGASASGGSMDAGPDVSTCAACGGNTPICLQGSCVQCLASSDCNGDSTKPVCDTTTHTCAACTSDSQCVAKLGSTGNPGICMSQIDGHCATDAEAIYVQNTTPTCKTTFVVGGGTAANPYCSLDPIGLALSDTQSLVVIRGTVNNGGAWTYQRTSHPMTSFIGQQAAVVASSTTPGFNMTGGLAYLREIRFTSAASEGISASGGTLVVDTVVIDSCQGGGVLLNGAAFNISNTTVTNNGPGQMGPTAWGGILVNLLPPSGPTTLNLDTIQGNKGPGVLCSGQITGTGVLASGNSTTDIATTACGFTSCTPAGAGCGAP
jgi:hypothetical protein